MCNFGKEVLALLREAVRQELSPYRFAHTLGVEACVGELALLYCPEKADLLRAAALLHDITKEKSNEEQMEILLAHGISLRKDELASPKIWHGITAPLVIAERYGDYAHPELLSAVRYHTTGHADMTLCEALLYLADYIEQGRDFSDCVALRERFWGAGPAQMSQTQRLSHLREVLHEALVLSLNEISGKGASPCLDSVFAERELKEKTTFSERV